MQGGKTEVAGFCERDCVVHGVAIADLAHQDHVRGLAQGVFQRHLPAFGIDPEFALRNDAVLVLMHELDRIFHCDDVSIGVLVAVIHQRRERGRFTGAGAADENDQAALGHGDIAQHCGQSEFFQGRDALRDGPQYQADPTLLNVGIRAETTDARGRNREVAFLGRFKLGGLAIVHDRTRQIRSVRRRQHLVGLRHDAPIHLDGWWKACGDEQVGAVFLQHQTQQIMHESKCLIAFH